MKCFLILGPYHVIAVLHELDGPGVLESAPVAVQVREPEGLNRLAFKAIREFEEKGNEYFWGGRNLATSQEFVLRHGDTRYGAYVAYALGKHFLNDRDYDRAIEYFTIASQRPDFLEGEQALQKLLEAHGAKGQEEQVAEVEKELKRRYPHSTYFESE